MALAGALAMAMAGALAGALAMAMAMALAGAMAGAMAGALAMAMAGAMAGALPMAMAGAMAMAMAGAMAMAINSIGGFQYPNMASYPCPACGNRHYITVQSARRGLLRSEIGRTVYQYSCLCGYRTRKYQAIQAVRTELDNAI